MTKIHIPPEVIEAFQDIALVGPLTARAAITAALQAWPGMKQSPSWDLRTHERRIEIILPIIRTETST